MAFHSKFAMANIEAFLETGEEYWDSETGEMRQAVICLRSERQLFTNAETGEPEVYENLKKRSFQVPKSLQISKKNEDGQFSEKQNRTNCIKESMVSGTQNVSPMVFMLPTLFFFPAWASILCVIFEALIHIWTHKRNKFKGNHQRMYRSPLHLISSEFCAHCRTHIWMKQISRIQDKRSLRRKLIHPDIIKGVVR